MSYYNCCVPGCTNSFRNASHLHYYRIPKDDAVRKVYKFILKNESLKLESSATRICSERFEGGEKLSRTHLPMIFPWPKPQVKRRELKRLGIEETEKVEKAKRQKRLPKQNSKLEASAVSNTAQSELSQNNVVTNNNSKTQTQTSLTALDIEALVKDLQN